MPPPIAKRVPRRRRAADGVALVVQETGKARPLIAHNAAKPMNPASVMKLVTTFAALELLGRDYRWTTDAYLDGTLDDGTLHGNLVLKGHGDPKITVEQWQAFMAMLRAHGLNAIDGDLVLDRSFFAPIAHDPAAFDGEPLKPYNVGPDALLVNFKSIRFGFAPNPAGTTDVIEIPTLANVVLGPSPRLAAGDCGDWRAAVGATFVDRGGSAEATFRRKLSGFVRRARVVGVSARPDGVRVFDVRDVLPRGRRPLLRRLEERARAPGGRDAVRNPRIAAALRSSSAT